MQQKLPEELLHHSSAHRMALWGERTFATKPTFLLNKLAMGQKVRDNLCSYLKIQDQPVIAAQFYETCTNPHYK